MRKKDLDDIEKSLDRLVPRAAPPGLGRRVVARALDSRKNAAVSPRMRAVAGLCFVLTSLVVIGDTVISKWQSGRIAALLGGPGVSKPAGEDALLQWAELGADMGELDKFRRERIVLSRLASRGGLGRAYLEARDWLKGMIDYEDPEVLY